VKVQPRKLTRGTPKKPPPFSQIQAWWMVEVVGSSARSHAVMANAPTTGMPIVVSQDEPRRTSPSSAVATIQAR
jgi:hypothetical protein